MPDPIAASDRSHAMLQQAHDLLARPVGDQSDVTGLLADLVTAAAAAAAGLVGSPDPTTAFVFPHRPQPADGVPWLRDPAWAAHVHRSPSAVAIDAGERGLDLVASVGFTEPGWLLWLEPRPGRAAWTDAEAAALSVVGCVLSRMMQPGDRPRWGTQLDRAARQQQLETAAAVTRRLSHDFGNILTGILGFTELALAQQLPANSPLQSYLSEAYRAAQAGAQFTHQLRTFSRRQSTTSGSCALPMVLGELEARLFNGRDNGVHFRMDVPADLPPAALGPDQMQQVLAALLENSREALTGAGAISVSARTVDLSPAECLDLYGDVRPGQHVEVVIADTGSGLLPEAAQRLFLEPFFSTKPRRRGFGLATAYGILHAHRGGLRLHPGEERGVVARVVIPVGIAPPAASVLPAVTAATADNGSGERVLVVDDEADVLSFVVAALQRAGFRPTGMRDGAAALEAYFASGPYHLVLTDVMMAPLNGVELVQRLLKRDPAARVVFMSGRVPADFMREDFAGRTVEFLAKPFRPEQLVRAVRAVLDRPARRPTPAPLSGSPKN